MGEKRGKGLHFCDNIWKFAQGSRDCCKIWSYALVLMGPCRSLTLAPLLMNSIISRAFSFTAVALLTGSGGVFAEEGPVSKEQMASGKRTYALCAACHGPDGMGVQPGSMIMAPSLQASEVVTGDPSVFALVILKGIQKTDAKYMQMMAGQEAALSDGKLADIMTYVRRSFGNEASVVTREEAAKYRREHLRKGAVTREELARILESD